MRHLIPTFLSFILVLSSCSVTKYNAGITADELSVTTKYLTSSPLAGRLTGTEGDSLTRIFIRQELKNAGLKPFTDNGFQYFSVKVPFIIPGTDSIKTRQVTTANVAMMIEGNDPELKSQYVIIGAHFDHLGMGGKSSSAGIRILSHFTRVLMTMPPVLQ